MASKARPPMTPSSVGVSERMSRVRRRDTAPELELRSELHRRGLRYRIDRRPLKGVPSRADLVFGPAKVAVYVDGCFWHSCPDHGTMPRSNEAFWLDKLARNQERDAAVNGVLAAAGWTVVRIWEHEEIDAAADRVEAAVRVSLGR
ncbi:MAG TPA: very short patch repair endonuclease [Solirubrobacterales bacterium]|nr:very short patch repair endonuclease [Solirubrobacterales bacterium]